MSNLNHSEFAKLPQIVARCRLKENRGGGEIITFPIHLVHFHFICTVNVPANGENESTGYVKFLVQDEREQFDARDFERAPQIVVRCRLKENREDGEVLTFTIHLMHFHLVCTVNIPPNGETESTAYVKFMVQDARELMRGESKPSRNSRAA